MILTETGKVVITLSEKLYPEDRVEKAIHDFKDICKIEKKGSQISMVPLTSDVDKKIIALEFSNYVLGLINEGEIND